jgi:(4S)-4-hydroxy-5-phosphonooxypentane-2,3-dione isomerase
MQAIFVTLTVKPEERERFLQAAEDDSICSPRDEAGCLQFKVLQDKDDPNRFYFFEVYRDEAAFQAHQQMPHYARWRAAAAEVLAAPSSRVSMTTVFPAEEGAWG